ncbi:hypothetical protein AB834_01725 [PVC group bacterium (ex Bugula neritina AB1)]|nr:hypothetical protein AB834_01725 [PVC group bacterium (ex Bugula neritina AB1)]
MLHFITYLIFRTIKFFLKKLPYFLNRAFGIFLGKVSWKVLKSRRSYVIDNLRKSSLFDPNHPEEVEAIAKKVFTEAGITLTECLCLEKFTKAWKNRLSYDLKDFENAKKTAKERGLIIVAHHWGNWELLSMVLSKISPNTLAVGQTIKNPFINSWVKKMREKFFTNVSNKKDFLSQALKTLKKKGLVTILVDQNAGDHGIPISFMGRKAQSFTTHAILSIKTNAPLLLVYNQRDKNGYHTVDFSLMIYPENFSSAKDKKSAIIDMTQLCLDSLESKIKETPERWFWFHRRWKI